MTDITGFGELTPYKGGWCGNDAFTHGMEKERADVRRMAQKLGDRLYKEGYRGAFCMDFLIDTDTREVYLGELNPRISGASPMTHLVTSTYGGVPDLPVPSPRVHGRGLRDRSGGDPGALAGL